MKNSENAFEKNHASYYVTGSYSNHNQNAAESQNRPTFNSTSSYTPMNDRYCKTNVSIKNHTKCIDLVGMALETAQYSRKEAVVIAYNLVKVVKSELLNMHESLTKEVNAHNSLRHVNIETHKEFIEIFEEELEKLDELISRFSEQVPSSVLNNPKESDSRVNLVNFCEAIRLETAEELVLVSRLIDYIEEKMLIKKSTYDKLTKEQLFKQVKMKINKMTVKNNE